MGELRGGALLLAVMLVLAGCASYPETAEASGRAEGISGLVAEVRVSCETPGAFAFAVFKTEEGHAVAELWHGREKLAEHDGFGTRSMNVGGLYLAPPRDSGNHQFRLRLVGDGFVGDYDLWIDCMPRDGLWVPDPAGQVQFTPLEAVSFPVEQPEWVPGTRWDYHHDGNLGRPKILDFVYTPFGGGLDFSVLVTIAGIDTVHGPLDLVIVDSPDDPRRQSENKVGRVVPVRTQDLALPSQPMLGIFHLCRGPSACLEHLDRQVEWQPQLQFPLTPESSVEHTEAGSMKVDVLSGTVSLPMGEIDVVRIRKTFEGAEIRSTLESDYSPVLGAVVHERMDFEMRTGPNEWYSLGGYVVTLTNHEIDPAAAMDAVELGRWAGLRQEGHLQLFRDEVRALDTDDKPVVVGGGVHTKRAGDQFNWTLYDGDSVLVQAPGAVLTHKFAAPGVYRAEFAGKDRNGATLGTMSIPIYVDHRSWHQAPCAPTDGPATGPCQVVDLPVRPGASSLELFASVALPSGGYWGTLELIGPDGEVVASVGPGTEALYIQYDFGEGVEEGWTARVTPLVGATLDPYVLVNLMYGEGA